jgi:hypothetical protein
MYIVVVVTSQGRKQASEEACTNAKRSVEESEERDGRGDGGSCNLSIRRDRAVVALFVQ